MTGWTGGYPTDATYGIAWQAAQTPMHAGLVCALAGVDWQPRAGMVVADIGCGRGFAAGVLAAANPGWTVIGLDHNPAHVAEARAVADRAALPNARFIEADLGAMTDADVEAWPPLDVVMIHGVWTWVSDAVRTGIVRLLARRLKPGGIAYLGYNALPGSGPDFGLQRLFRHFAGTAPGGSAARAAAAAEAIRHLAATNPRHLPPTAMLRRLLDGGLEPGFLAHEFLTDHWRPVFHADLCADLAPARLSFVGSANLFEHRPGMVFSTDQAAAIAGMGGGELLKDLCLSRPFRADVFQRGVRRIDPTEALDRILLAPCATMPVEGPRLVTPTGIAGLPAEAWAPMAAAMTKGPCRLGALRRLGAGAPIDPADLLVLLEGSGAVLPVADWAGDGAPARRFNQAAAAMLADRGEAAGQFALAAPLVGGGVACSALDLALVGAILDAGRADPGDLARRLRPGLDAAGQVRVAARVESILAERFLVWRGLGVL